MANVVEIPVKINVDKAKKDLETLRNRIKELNEAEGDNEALTRQLEKEYDELSENLEKASKSSGGLVSNMSSLPGPVGQAAKGFQGLTAAAKAFILNPIGAVITAIVGALMLMKTALASSEEGQLKLAKVTGTLKGVMTGLKEVLVQVAPLIGDIFSGNWGKIAEDWNKVKDAFGNISNVAQQTGEIAEARQKLSKATAEWSLQESKLTGELEKQRTISEDNTKSEAERSKANKAVYDIQKKIIEGNLALKQKEIELTKQEQALSSNTLEDNIDLINLQKEEQDLINQLDKAKTDYIKKQNQIAKKGDAQTAAEEKAAQEEFEREKKNNANLIALQKQRVDALRKGSTEWLAEQKKLIDLTYQADVFAAQGDTTLLSIAEGKKEQAIKLAEETAEAYVKAQKETLDKLNKLVSPDLDKTKWDKMRSDLQEELDNIDKQISDALTNQNITAEQAEQLRTLLKEKESQKRKDIEEDEANYTKELYRNAADSIIDGLIDITEVNAEQSKAMFNTNKALQIAQATIEGARGAIKIFADETAPTAVKVAEAAALGATTAATIAKISKTKFGGGASSSGGSGSISFSKPSTKAAENESISRNIRDDRYRTSVQTVLVVDDVTAKQMGAERVKVRSKI